MPRLRGSATGSLSLHLPVSLAGPRPSDSAGPSRRCRVCSRPHPALPGPDCPQLQRPPATGRRWISHPTRSFDASWRTTCSQHTPGKSQGRPPRKPSSKLIVQRRPAQLRSPRRPPSRSADLRAGPGQQPSRPQFHTPRSGSGRGVAPHAAGGTRVRRPEWAPGGLRAASGHRTFSNTSR